MIETEWSDLVISSILTLGTVFLSYISDGVLSMGKRHRFSSLRLAMSDVAFLTK